MRKTNVSALLAALLSMTSAPLFAQLVTTGPVTNGHHHFRVSDVDEQLRFWVDTLGGTADTLGADPGVTIVKFPDALVALLEGTPSGGMVGSSVDHVAFTVPNLREMVDRLVAAGHEMVTAGTAPPGIEVVDGIARIDEGPVAGFAHVLGPGGIKVELLEINAQQQAIVSHHIHFYGADPERMRDWYVDIFGAQPQPGPLPTIFTAALPGLALNFTRYDGPLSGTQGRALDHIGFEIDDLEAFCAELENRGIEFDVTYSVADEIDTAYALLTDPWGTYIELTEGLDNIQ